MNKLLKSMAVLPLMIAVSQVSFAAEITCDEPTDDRKVKLDYNVGTVTCGPSGVTSEQPEGKYFSGNGYTKLSKIEIGDDDPLANSDFEITDGGGWVLGTFDLAMGLTDLTAVFKFGGGNSEPDWISFNIEGITDSETFTSKWSVDPAQQALSHVTLWSKNAVAVPAPGALGLFSLGLMGLVVSRLRRS